MTISDRIKGNLSSLDPARNSEWRDTVALRGIVQHEFQTDGHLSWGTYEAVLDWKLRKQRKRTDKHRDGLTADLLREITGCFARIKHDDEKTECKIKLDVLSAIPGVGIGVASAILSLAHPDAYAIIDFRVWKVLYAEAKKNFTMGNYQKYLEDVRKIAAELDCDAQEVDFLLWKEFEKSGM